MVHNARKVWTMRYLLIVLLLCGCAKTATQTITETAQQQLNAIEQSITPECRTTATTIQINALRSTINSQLSTCELAQSKLKSDITKWQVIAIALFGALLLLGYIKIR